VRKVTAGAEAAYASVPITRVFMAVSSQSMALAM